MEHYRPNHELETKPVDPEEEALRALVDGIGVIHEFIDPQRAKAFGKLLSEQIGDDEDTTGTPLDTDLIENDVFTASFNLTPEQIEELRSIENFYLDLLRKIYPEAVDQNMFVSGEVLKYITSGMPAHTDNYGDKFSLADKEKAEISILNGVVTLMGEADYSYLDPETNKWETIRVKPGTLLISRSGDIQGLPQIKHAVSPPQTNDSGELSERIVLLLGTNYVITND